MLYTLRYLKSSLKNHRMGNVNPHFLVLILILLKFSFIWGFWCRPKKCMLISEKESLIDSDYTETNGAHDEKGHTQGGS